MMRDCDFCDRSSTTPDSSHGGGIHRTSAALLNTANSGLVLSALLDSVRLLPPGSQPPAPHRVAALLGGTGVDGVATVSREKNPAGGGGASVGNGAGSVPAPTSGGKTLDPSGAVVWKSGGGGVLGGVGKLVQRCTGGVQWAPAWQRTQGGAVRDANKVAKGKDTPWLEQVSILLQRAIKVRRWVHPRCWYWHDARSD